MKHQNGLSKEESAEAEKVIRRLFRSYRELLMSSFVPCNNSVSDKKRRGGVKPP